MPEKKLSKVGTMGIQKPDSTSITWLIKGPNWKKKKKKSLRKEKKFSYKSSGLRRVHCVVFQELFLSACMSYY